MFKSRLFKSIACMAVVLVFMLGMSACTSKEASNDNEVTLKWVLGGAGKQQDSDEVWELFNKKLQEKLPNTRVEFEVIPTAEYAEKWKLFAASGEQIDIAWFGWMLNMEKEARSGSISPITELLDSHGKELKGVMEDWVWDTVKIDNEIYAVPNYQIMVSRPTAFRTPKALADQYLNKERLVKAWTDWAQSEEVLEMPDEFFDAIEDYLLKLKEAGKIGLGISPEVFSGWLNPVNQSRFDNFGIVTKENDKVVVKDINDYYLHYYERINQLYKKGLIRKDAATVKDHSVDTGVEGGYVIWAHQYDDYTKAAEEKSYGMELEYIMPENAKCTRYYKAGGTNTVILRTCRNPERAMQLLNLINSETGKELYNLLVYGIEGKHYIKTGENTIETIGYTGTPTAESAYGINDWIVGNTFNAYDTQTDEPGYADYVRNVLHANSQPNLLQGFVFNSDAIKMEKSQLDSINTEFSGLATGAFENYKDLFKQKREKLQKSGIEKALKEVQAQLDAWQNQ